MKKFLSIALSVTTIVWLSGIALVLPALKATAITLNEGDLIRGPDGIKVYIINDKAHGSYAGWKRHIFNPQVFNMYQHFSWNSIKSVDQATLDSYETSDLYRAVDDTKVYKLEEIDEASSSAVKHWLNMTPEEFVANGYSWDQVFIVNSTERDFYVTGDPIGPGGTPSANLNVSLAADNPSAVTVPKKATNITALKFDVSGSGTITGLTFERAGVGAATDFEAVYLYEGATRLTSAKTINSTSQEVTFTNLNLAVSGTKSYSLVVDMDDDSPVAGNVSYFKLKSIETSSSVAGLPVQGNTITVGGSAAGSLTVSKGTPPTNPKIGQKEVAISQFKIAASTEDAKIQRIAVYQAGSISRSYVTNLKLYQGSSLLASVAEINSKDLIVFDLSSNPYVISKGNTRIFDIKADISGSAKAGDTIKTYIDVAADVYAIGGTYGYGMTVDISSSGNFDGSGSNYIEVTLQGGTVTGSSSGPIASNVSKRATDVNFIDFSISSAVNADIKTLRIELHAVGTDLDASDTTYTSNYITDIKVWDTDKNTVVAGPIDINDMNDIGSSAGLYYNFTNFDTISAGTSKNYRVTLDLSNNLATGSQLYVTIGKEAATSYFLSSTSVKNTDNNQYITDIVPNTSISGKYMTLTTASLALSVSSSPVSSTYIRGAKNVPSLGIIFTAGDGSDIKITSIKISAYVSDYDAITDAGLTKDETGTLTAASMIEAVRLYDGDTQLGDVEAINSSGEATFDGFTWTVPAGSSKTLTIKSDISSSVNIDGGDPNYAIFAYNIVDASEDIASTDSENNDVDGTPDDVNATEASSGTGAKTYIIVAESGTLTNSQDAGRPNSALQVAGSAGVLFNKVRFTATNEEFKITKMRVKIDDATNDRDNVVGVKISDGTTTWGPISLDASGNADFSNLAIIVPKDGHKVVSIYADLQTISGGADTGDSFSLDFDYDNNFEAIGTGSNTKVTSVTADSVGNDMVIVKTKPTITALDLPSTTLINGTLVLYKFQISADAGADVSIKKIHFDVKVSEVSGTDIDITNLQLFEVGNSTQLNVSFYDGVLGTGTAATLSGSGTGYLAENANSDTAIAIVNTSGYGPDGDSNGELVISAGQSKTYELKGTIADVAEIGDSISTRIASALTTSTTVGAPTLDSTDYDSIVNVGGTDTYLMWSDNSVLNHSATLGTGSADWITDYLVETLPTDYKTLQYSS